MLLWCGCLHDCGVADTACQLPLCPSATARARFCSISARDATALATKYDVNVASKRVAAAAAAAAAAGTGGSRRRGPDGPRGGAAVPALVPAVPKRPPFSNPLQLFNTRVGSPLHHILERHGYWLQGGAWLEAEQSLPMGSTDSRGCPRQDVLAVVFTDGHSVRLPVQKPAQVFVRPDKVRVVPCGCGCGCGFEWLWLCVAVAVAVAVALLTGNK